MFLTSTSDIIRVVTGSAVSSITAQADWIDYSAGSYTPGRTNTAITTATTTTVVASPAASTYRALNGLVIANTSASSCAVTVQHYDGTTSVTVAAVTLLAGESLVFADPGGWRHFAVQGMAYEYSLPAKGNLGISGTIAETIPRELCTEANIGALTTGTLYLQAVLLTAGQVCTNVSFFSGTTAAGTPTNQLFAIYSKNRALLAATADDTTTAWNANTIKTLALTGTYTVPVTDLYYIGIMVAATTVPTLKGVASSNVLTAFPLSLRGNSTSGLTTTLPNPCGAPSAGSNIVWAAIT